MKIFKKKKRFWELHENLAFGLIKGGDKILAFLFLDDFKKCAIKTVFHFSGN
jgi:hypothetical protein